MATPKEEEARFIRKFLELIESEEACARLNSVLLDIARRRDASLFALLKENAPAALAAVTATITKPPPRFEDDEKNIMLYIERNKNKNVVVYRGLLAEKKREGAAEDKEKEKKDKKEREHNKTAPAGTVAAALEKAATASDTVLNFHDKEPLDAYWLDIDPEYVKANRKKGIEHNRCELNMIDRNMAYGITVGVKTPIEPIFDALSSKKAVCASCPFIDPRVFPVTFVALGSCLFFQALAYVPTRNAATPFVYLPIIMGFVDKKLCVMERIFVTASEGGMFSLPKVEHVDVVGYAVPSSSSKSNYVVATEVSERIKP